MTVAIVTGGALGIGGATARRLAADGARVLVVDIDLAAAEANVTRIEAAGGVAIAHGGDVGSEGEAAHIVRHAVDEWGRLDILVNNAWGAREPDGSALTLSESSFDAAMNILVRALFLASKQAAPHMAANGGGSIVNIASVHGLLAAPGRLAYDTAKAAAIHLTRQMAVDLGPLGIRVNAINPGHIVTERSGERWERNPSYLEFFKQQYPLRRVGTPDDIANAVAFLCSDQASFITGQAIAVDGGLAIQLQEDLAVRLAQWYRDHPETRLP
jgi:3-oxoacyl-[acyl-carrier protein] reductase